MKKIFLLLLLSSILFAADFGASKLVLERVWTVSGPANEEFDFDSMLVVNNSHQKIISISTTPIMQIVQDENGSIRVKYNGTVDNGKVELKATAIVVVDYDHGILSDSVLPTSTKKPTTLTEYSTSMEQQAKDLSVSSSTLNTIRNLTSWVNSFIKYDESYFALIKSAKEVYKERKGVCVEYTHLLISLSNALGLETRYVTGYVLGKEWQPHAWVEFNVPGYGWLPADATFNQVGNVDNSHVVMAYGVDQSSISDSIYSVSTLSFSARNSVRFVQTEKNNRDLSINCSLDNNTMMVNVLAANNKSAHVFTTYKLAMPTNVGTSQRDLLLLKPKENRVFNYSINSSFFKKGFLYTIPLSCYLNDAESKKTFKIHIPNKAQKPVTGKPTTKNCMPSFIMLILLPLILWKKF